MDEDTESGQRASTHGAGQAVALNLTLPREHPWKQPAVYIAILALLVSMAGFQRKSSDIEDLKADNRNYRNDISMWETDVFNRDKTIDAYLTAHGIDTAKFGKITPPPER